jgi:L-alanine-DL-glutamate epimerase-like enolase superfamily enzyme
VTKIGGITEIRKIIALAEPHSVELIPSVPHGPGLGVEPDMRIVEKYRQGAIVKFR